MSMAASKSKKEKKFKVVFHGLACSGKTSLLYALNHEEFTTDARIFYPDFQKIRVAGVDTFFWDHARRERSRPLYLMHYRGAHGFIYVIDSNDEESLDESVDELNRSIFQKEETQNTVILVLASKQDIATALPVETIEERVREKISSNEETRGGRYMLVKGCSAKTNEGLFEAVSEFIEKIVLVESLKIDSTTEETDSNKKSKIQTMTGNIGSHVHALKRMFKSVLFY